MIGRFYAVAILIAVTAPEGWSQPAPADPPIDAIAARLSPKLQWVRGNLVLLDQSMCLLVRRGAATRRHADSVFRASAKALASRTRAAGLDTQIAAMYRSESAEFLQAVDRAVSATTRWPDDRPPTEYTARARTALADIRAGADKDLAGGIPPIVALPMAEQVLALTEGRATSFHPATSFFAGGETRVSAAIDGAIAPTKAAPAVLACGSGA